MMINNESIDVSNKCQYKTGKCIKQRALKRSGQLHSLCEEHRMKQNTIQRRSDRKYQNIHAQRRRQKTQQKALLKKQLSLALAQQVSFNSSSPTYLNMNLSLQKSTLLPAPISTSISNPVLEPLSSPTGINELIWETNINQPSSPSTISETSTTSCSEFSVDNFFNQQDEFSISMDDIPLWNETEIEWKDEDLDILLSE